MKPIIKCLAKLVSRNSVKGNVFNIDSLAQCHYQVESHEDNCNVVDQAFLKPFKSLRYRGFTMTDRAYKVIENINPVPRVEDREDTSWQTPREAYRNWCAIISLTYLRVAPEDFSFSLGGAKQE